MSVNNHGPDPEAERLAMAIIRHGDVRGSIVASLMSLRVSPAGSPSLGSLSAALLILSCP
jgi:hypothetical protein